MAIDSPQKRFSAMNHASPWRGPSVLPTGTIGAAQRQAALLLYSGILADAPVAPSPATLRMDHRFLFPRRRAS